MKVGCKIIHLELVLIIGITAKRLAKGISKTAENVEIILQVRNEVGASLTEVEESTIGGQPAFIETNDCTFSLPDLSSQSGWLGNDPFDCFICGFYQSFIVYRRISYLSRE